MKLSLENLEHRDRWDRNSLSKADAVSGVPYIIDKDIARDPSSKMRNGKFARSSRLVLRNDGISR